MIPAEPRRRAALAFIFVTVALDIVALGIVIPVLPQLVLEFTRNTARAAEVVALFGAAWGLMQFVFSPLLGALSDRHGRRPVILLSNFGLAFDYALMALAPTLGWLFVGRLISGITAASISTAFAYVADVTAPEKRAGAFGVLGAAFGLGFVIGPALGGLLGGVDSRLPFWVAGGLSLVNALYGLFVLPESLPRERRAAFSWRRANPLGAFKLLRSHRELLGLAGINFVDYLAHGVLPAVFVLYAGYRYDWRAQEVGLVLAGVGVCSAVVQAGLTGGAVKRFGERRTIQLGLFFGGLGFAIYGLAPDGWLFLLGVPVMALWGLSAPAIQGLMSARVHPSEQGQLQGANASVSSLTSVISPALFGFVFATTVGEGTPPAWAGAAFLLAAAMLFAAMPLAWRVTRRGPERHRAPTVVAPAP